jgi:hypothetical protein
MSRCNTLREIVINFTSHPGDLEESHLHERLGHPRADQCGYPLPPSRH